MLELVWRDTVEHRVVWAGAVLVSAVTSMFTTACFNALLLGMSVPDSAFSRPDGRDALMQTSANLLFLSGGPAILVLAVVLGTLVTQTRSGHALWRLAGASPQQVLRGFTMQVVLACVVGAFIGALAALPFQAAATSVLKRGLAVDVPALPGSLTLLAVVGSMVLVTFWGMLAGLGPAVRACKVSPLVGREPDRQSSDRWVTAALGLGFVVLVQLPLLVPLLAVPSTESVVQGLVTLLPAGQAMVITVALFAPFFLAPMMRSWTALPGLTARPPWRVARHLAVSRATQSTATVLPLMVGIGLFATFNIVGTAARNAGGPEGRSINLFDGVLMLTPIGVIGAAGSAAVVFMASRKRSRDLTAMRVAGASPAGSLAVFGSEAVIYVLSAILVAVIPAVGTAGLLALALTRRGLPLDLTGLELTGSLVVGVLGAVTTTAIIMVCGALAWRRPLTTALAER